ncbi:hypothetical protein GX48_07610 [Paracoccidioides brasiliensis]|nr:hypothetical protein GX48_07610 [Paracoccidioides brasiliensis]
MPLLNSTSGALFRQNLREVNLRAQQLTSWTEETGVVLPACKGMQSTAWSMPFFACGIFYERFAPGGMASFQIGKSTRIDAEGDYLMNIRAMTTEIPYFIVMGDPVCVCMTSAQDLVRYIVAALDLPQWPTEFRVYGERMTLSDVVNVVENVRGVHFEKTLLTDESLETSLAHAKASSNILEQWSLHHLLATTAGCYDFGAPNLHSLDNVNPQKFCDWLHAAWSLAS